VHEITVPDNHYKNVTGNNSRKDKEPPVIHIGPTPFFSNRGCHIRILNEIKGLQAQGRHVILCTYGLGHEVAGLVVRRIWSIPGYTKTDAGFSLFKPVADILLFFLVVKVVWQQKPTVVHGHLHEGGLIGWCVKVLFFWRGIKLVMDLQGSLSGELRAYGTFRKLPFILSFFYILERLICLMPNRIICSSQSSLDFLINTCKVDRRKIQLVGDVVPDSFFEPLNRDEFRRRLKIPADKRVIIYSGSLLPGKGVDLLVESLKQVLPANQDSICVLIGYPKDWVEREFKGTELENQVFLPGEVEYSHLADWLGTADLAVDPKPSGSGEASGKILHYMAAGLPIVCFNTENNRRFLADQAFYAVGGSARELANAINFALTDSEARRKYGAVCRSRAQKEFSLESTGWKLDQLYRQF